MYWTVETLPPTLHRLIITAYYNKLFINNFLQFIKNLKFLKEKTKYY